MPISPWFDPWFDSALIYFYLYPMMINPETAPRTRFASIDMMRGAAILLMFIYHFSWDLTFFGYASFDLFNDPFWLIFARFIVAIILLVMGMAQIMARGRGTGLNAKVFSKRLGIILLCAAGVSGATYFVDAGSFVFFGILHHIALASILLIGAVRLPSAAIAVLTAFCFAAPWFLAHGIFSAGSLLWIGLSPVAPVSVDYVPLFPWFGIPLLGLLVGRALVPGGTVLSWNPDHGLWHLVRCAGRHSLLLYMIHQPILFGGLYAFAFLQGRI